MPDVFTQYQGMISPKSLRGRKICDNPDASRNASNESPLRHQTSQYDKAPAPETTAKICPG